MAAEHPELVAELRSRLEDHAREIAANQRPPGMADTALPLIAEPGDLPKLRELMGLEDFEALTARP